MRSLLPWYATRRCFEAVHACIQNIQQLLGHAGAQLASRPLLCCYGPHRVVPSFLRSRTWGQTAMFTRWSYFDHQVANPNRHPCLAPACSMCLSYPLPALSGCVLIHSSSHTQEQLSRPEAVPVMLSTTTLASCNMPQQVHSSFLHAIPSCW